MRMRVARTQTIAIAGAVFALAVARSWSDGQSGFAAVQSAGHQSPLHGVLRQHKLTPPLSAPIRQVRFSPNGSFILLQDEAGIRVLAREPLSLRLLVTAPDALPAYFSADSKYVNVAAAGLNSARYDLTFGEKVSETPPFDPEGCLAAAISSDGELAACLNPEFHLTVFRMASKETIFSEVVGEPPPSRTPIPVPRGTQSAFAEPFGYFYSASMKGWVGRRDYGSTMAFSTAGRFVLARHANGDAAAVDLSSRKKIPVPDALKKRLGKAWCFAGSDRIIVLDAKKESDSEVISFPAGKVMARFPATGSSVAMLSQPRYARIDTPSIGPPNGDGPRVFDLESNGFVESLPTGAADILQDLAAIYLSNGKVSLHKLGESQPREEFMVPVNPLPPLRTAVVSPNLDYFAVAVRGAGAIYRSASGEQVASVPQMNGAWFANEETLYSRSREPGGASAVVQRLDLKSGKAARAWSGENPAATNRPNDDLRCAGPSLLVVVPAGSKPIPGSVGMQMQSTQAYELRALKMENGKRLWSRAFLRDVPVPFADPQGDRVVLAWAATSETGRNEAGRVPNSSRHPKPSNLSELDTFFEVLDARSGKIIGGALAQLGAGAENFDGAYSAGDSLIVSKDSIRITIFSLSTGQEVARLRGAFSSASGETNLLAASDAKRLTMYDLKSGAKRGDFLSPEDVAYTHFSADGKRVLVLTANQTVYVLDVSGAAAPDAAPAKP